MQSHSEKHNSTSTSFFRLLFLGWLINAIIGDAQILLTARPSRYSDTRKKQWIDSLNTPHQKVTFHNTWTSLTNLELQISEDVQPHIQQKISNTVPVNFQNMLISNSTHEFSFMIMDSSLLQDIERKNSSAVRLFLSNYKDLITGQVILPSTQLQPVNAFFNLLLKKDWSLLRIYKFIALSFDSILELPSSHQHFICNELESLKYKLDTNEVCKSLLLNKEDALFYYISKAIFLGVLMMLVDYMKNDDPDKQHLQKNRKSLEEILKKYLTKTSLKPNTFADIEKNLKSLDASFLEKSDIVTINKGFEKIFLYHKFYSTLPRKNLLPQVIFIFSLEIALFWYVYETNKNILWRYEQFGFTAVEMLSFLLRSILELSVFEMLSKKDIQFLEEAKESLNTLAKTRAKKKGKMQSHNDEYKTYQSTPAIFNPDDFHQQKKIFDELYQDYLEKMTNLRSLFGEAQLKHKIKFKDAALQSLMSREAKLTQIYLKNTPSEENLIELKDAILLIQQDFIEISSHKGTIKDKIYKKKREHNSTNPSKLQSSALTTKTLKEKKSEVSVSIVAKKEKQPSLPKPPAKTEKKPLPAHIKKTSFSLPASTSTSSNEIERQKNPNVIASTHMFESLLSRFEHDKKNVPAEAIADMEILLKTFLICVTCNYFHKIKKLRNNTLYYLDNIIKDKDKDNFTELWSAAEQCFFYMTGQKTDLPTPFIQKIKDSNFSLDQDPKLKMFDHASNKVKVGSLLNKIEKVKESKHLTSAEKDYLLEYLKQLRITFARGLNSEEPGFSVTHAEVIEAERFRHPPHPSIHRLSTS